MLMLCCNVELCIEIYKLPSLLSKVGLLGCMPEFSRNASSQKIYNGIVIELKRIKPQ